MITEKQNLKRYTNISDAIYDYAKSLENHFETNIEIKKDTEIHSIDYTKLTQVAIFNQAKEMFNKIGQRVFKNNNEIIYVSNSDIKESIAKTIRNIEQKKIIAEHMEVFANLDKIIENGIKIATANERKGRYQNLNWDYYATPIKIDGKKYIVEFDTLLRERNEKHFRLQRIYSLENAIKKQAVPTGRVDNQRLDRFVEQPVSNNDNNTL